MKKYLIALLALLLPWAAEAATTANTFIAPQVPQRESYQFTSSSSAGTYETVYTAGSNGSVIDALFVTSGDSSATHVINCEVVNSATAYAAATAVTTTSPASGSFNNLNILSAWTGLSVDQNGNPFLILVSGDTLQCTFATSITSGKFVMVTAIGGDY